MTRAIVLLVAIGSLIATMLGSAHADKALDRVDSYQPMYFGGGTQDGESVYRYRASFAVPISNEKLRLPGLPDGTPTFAFTTEATAYESSFWFGSTNFNPEAFYEWPLNFRWLDQVRFGVSHLSSGDRDSLSNGYNAGFVEMRVPVFEWDSLTVTAYVRPQVFVPLGFEPNTEHLRDLVTYIGKDFFPVARLVVDLKESRVAIDGHRDGYTVEGAARIATLLGTAGGVLDGALGRFGVPYADLGLGWLADQTRDRWNFHAYGRWHSGTLENIATYAEDVDSWQAGVAVMPGW